MAKTTKSTTKNTSAASETETKAEIHRCDWSSAAAVYACLAEAVNGDWGLGTLKVCNDCNADVHPECYAAALLDYTGGQIEFEEANGGVLL